MVLASCPPTLEADYHGPGSEPRYWPCSATCLTSLPQFSFGESSAHHPPPYTALCSWIFRWQELRITHCMLNHWHNTHTYTWKCETQTLRLGKLFKHPEQPFQIGSKLRREMRSFTTAFHAHYHVSTNMDTPDISVIRKFSLSLLHCLERSVHFMLFLHI